LGLLPREQYDEYKALLDGDEKDLRQRVDSSIALADGFEEMSPEGRKEFKERLVTDVIELGRSGGDLGFALFARTLGEGLNVKVGDEATAKTGEGILRLNPKEPLYTKGLTDVLNEEWFASLPMEQKLWQNSVAWNSATIVAHEMGHAYVGIKDEAMTVTLVQNPIARAFQAGGKTEMVRTKYGGFPVWPHSRGEGKKAKMVAYMTDDDLRMQVQVPYATWKQEFKKNKTLQRSFIQEWGTRE